MSKFFIEYIYIYIYIYIYYYDYFSTLKKTVEDLVSIFFKKQFKRF